MGDEILSSAEMRAIEAAAIAAGDAIGVRLMEWAGQAVVDTAFAHWPDLGAAPHRALVLAGPGNNGGDGFVIARLLAGWGWQVEVMYYGLAERLPPDARANHDRWQGHMWRLGYPALTGGDLTAVDAAVAALGPDDLVIDALFGTGLSRGIDALGGLVEAVGAGHARVVAVDIASGLCADSGRILGQGPALRADMTVTFHRAKRGHYLAQGPAHTGHLAVVPIGLAGVPKTAARLWRIDPAQLSKAGAGHKYAYGHALIIGGPSGQGGAARLAARAALRVGAGLSTLGAPPDAMAENAARLDAVMLREIGDDAALRLNIDHSHVTALCLGPALGKGAAAKALVAAALQPFMPADAPIIDVLDSRQIAAHLRRYGRRLPTVFDADALTIIAAAPDLLKRLHRGCVLTPHGGEFARLFPDLAKKLAAPAENGPAYSKIDAAQEAAARAGCVVLFKGADTVIAEPSGRATVVSAAYDRAAPWLATAGSGDVLAGLIAGLMARGLPPFEAAANGAWLHVEAARAFGPGLIAEDLPDMFPRVFRGLGL